MLTLLKRWGATALAATGATPVLAFSLLGPIGNGGDAYQTPVLSYGLGGDYGAPKNLGEEYRLTRPVIYYAYDANFLDYFGGEGVRAVDSAFAVFNGLTNVSAYTPELYEFPLDSQRINYRAQALGLLDIKSTTMSMTAEWLGLAEPTRWTWCLRKREGDCQNGFAYEVIMRNFDPLTWQPTRYVNGTRYTYVVVDFCPADQHDAIEIKVDPLTVEFNAVADYGLEYGGFYSTLTRDDVGGLRYMLRHPNANFESLGGDTVLVSTNANANALAFLITSNLVDLATVALTNNAATLQALFPTLVILESTPYLTNVVTTNVIPYFTNYPWSPASQAATLVYATNYDTNVVMHYRHTFGNVVSNWFVFPNGYRFTNQNVFALSTMVTSNRVTIIETNVGPPGGVWSYPGGTTLTTNVTVRHVWTNMITGDYFIPPTNLCGVYLLSNVLTKVTAITNTPLQATNLVTTNGQFYSLTYVTYVTNHHFAYFPVDCVTNATSLFHGIERVRFVRRDYDSLLGRFFEPIDDVFNVVAITNSQDRTQVVTRVVTQPDILITAADIRDGFVMWAPAAVLREVSAFNQSNVLQRLAGPGTIEPPATFVFSKVGPVFFNTTFFADEATAVGTNFVWASFDSSTNEPVVFPNTRSIVEVENAILMQLSPLTLPVGKVGRAYPTTPFVGQGGQAPYTWRLAPQSAGLPPGLTGLGVEEQPTATLAGTPLAPGIYDFVVRMRDSYGRFIDVPLFIRIDP